MAKMNVKLPEKLIDALEQIRNKPYSVLILDEIEKAHKSVINFFLNILDI